MTDLEKYLYERKDDFGRFCRIPTWTADNKYVYKIVTKIRSNSYCDVPVRDKGPVIHDTETEVYLVIVCGIKEDRVIRVAVKDCELIDEAVFSHNDEECAPTPQPYKLSDFHVDDEVYVARVKNSALDHITCARVVRVGRKYVTVDLFEYGLAFKIPEYCQLEDAPCADHMESVESAWNFYLFKTENEAKQYELKLRRIKEISKMKSSAAMLVMEQLSNKAVYRLWKAYHEVCEEGI